MGEKPVLPREAENPKLLTSLTGRMENQRKLLKLAEIPVAKPDMRSFFAGLARDLEDEPELPRLMARLDGKGQAWSKKRLAQNLLFVWAVAGAATHRESTSFESWMPNLVVLSPSMSCNLSCTGCRMGSYSMEESLSEDQVNGILAESRSQGIYFVVITGGEPYLLKDMLLRVFQKYNDMFFLTYTNGTLLDEPTVKALALLGNVVPAISVQRPNDPASLGGGMGAEAEAAEAMERLRRHGMVFGISVTYTRQNVKQVSTDGFVRHYIEQGAIFALYLMFVPVGKSPKLELVPTPEQRMYFGQRARQLREKHPILLAEFRNDSPAAGGCLSGGCLSGGCHYLHLLDSGGAEPCVFVH